MDSEINRIIEIISKLKPQLQELSLALWSNPEVAWQEHFAVAEAKKYLESRGLTVQSGCFGVETAFKCEYGTADFPPF